MLMTPPQNQLFVTPYIVSRSTKVWGPTIGFTEVTVQQMDFRRMLF